MSLFYVASTDALVFLSAESAVFVGAGATLYSTSNLQIPTIESLAAGRTVQIEGTVASQPANPVTLRMDEIGTGNHTVVIGTAGAAYGNANFASVFVAGTGNLLHNSGLITGGGGVWGNGWGAGRLENDGDIVGLRFAGVKLFDGVGSNTILNGGVITGTGGVVLQNATATIVNLAEGEIRSTSATAAAIDASLAGAAGFTLRNLGTVTGLDDAVLGSAGADTIRNDGLIDGDVLLGAGNDVFRGRKGLVEGELRGGDGNDTLISGRGDDLLLGERGLDRLDGGAGDDTMTGGQNPDVFVFSRAGAGGADLVTDFQDNLDDLDLTAFRLANFTVVSGLARDVTGGLLLDLATVGGGTVVLQGMTKALLDAGDVLI